MKRLLAAALIPGLLLIAQSPVTPELNNALARISAGSLKGNVSFLASDLLEGRATPSRGQDVAAEFLASRFRAAGLEPLGSNGSYFQEARFLEVHPKLDDLAVILTSQAGELKLNSDNVSIRSLETLDLKEAQVVTLPESGELPDLAGKVVAGLAQVYGSEAALLKLQQQKPRLILLLSKQRRGRPAASYLEEAESGNASIIRIANEDAVEAVIAGGFLKVSVHASAPEMKEFIARNIAGVLRGSDPVLKEEYVVLSAHYDHVGTKEGSGDTVFNGANDNGSGTASVVEIANALASLPTHPKRSILFLTVFGEEKGLLGAFYYSRHPLVPLAKTIAAVNLEQMGRTDDQDGKRVRTMSFTGATYSDLPDRMGDVAKTVDISVYKQPNADSFFARSDNYAFALQGVIAHTLVVAYEYPDYHALGDEWPKLDYDNMAAVDRAVAAGIVRLADDSVPPKWNEIKDTDAYRPKQK